MATQYRLFDWTFDYRSFGNMVRRRREDAGFSILHIAAVIGRSATYVGRVERGTCPTVAIGDVLALANAFDMDIRPYFRIEAMPDSW